MTFTLIDLILIGIVIVSVTAGFIMGLIQGVGALVGLAAGFFVATKYYNVLGDWLTPIFLGNAVWAKIITFILIFTLTSRLVGLVFWLVDKAFKIISIIPFLKSINRLGGAVLGLLEGILLCGLILGFLLGYFGDLAWIKDNLAGSNAAHWLIGAAYYIKDIGMAAVNFVISKF